MNKPLFPDISVNGTAISAAEIAAEAQNHAAPRGKPGIAWRQAAKALVIRRLLLDEAARLGLAAEPADLGNLRFETQDEANIRVLMEAEITTAPVGEAEAREIYLSEPDRFRAPPLYEASHILLAAVRDNEAARTRARQQSEAISATLQRHPARFADIAAAESACPSRENGGRLGQLTAGDTVPEFEAVLEQLAEGEITAVPVESRYGFHIIRLDARAHGAVLPFEAVRGRILDAVERKAWATAAADFVSGLVSKAEILGIDMQA